MNFTSEVEENVELFFLSPGDAQKQWQTQEIGLRKPINTD